MKEQITSKLYYGKYAFVAEIDCIYKDSAKILEWLKRKNIDFKHRSTPKFNRGPFNWYIPRCRCLVRQILIKLYLRTKDDYELVCKKYKSNLSSIIKPHNEEHEDLLRMGMNVIYRKKLLYNKYRYTITFKGSYQSNDVGKWLKQFVKDESEVGSRKISRNSSYDYNRHCLLYLTTEDDVVLVKLTWSEKIQRINVIRTFDEFDNPMEVIDDSSPVINNEPASDPEQIA